MMPAANSNESREVEMISKKRRCAHRINAEKRRNTAATRSIKRVRFDLQNVSIRLLKYIKLETEHSWISDEEQNFIKRGVAISLKTYRINQASKTTTDLESSIASIRTKDQQVTDSQVCVRGIEKFVNPEQTMGKMKSLSKHRNVVIFLSQVYRHHFQNKICQQRFPDAFKVSCNVLYPFIDLGTFNSKEEVFRHISIQFSEPFVAQAIAIAILDAKDAELIHNEIFT